MQFAIPQFTDVEDKLIGPLTLKQFLTLLATGGLALFFWSLFGLSIIFFFFAGPIVLLGVVVTFAKFNGRPFFAYVFPFFNFTTSPKVMIYKREGVPVTFSKKVVSAAPISSGRASPSEAGRENRLRKLAYVLDQKTSEEEKLIEEIK
ncbi:MAG: PrgI family protein [Candidatus Doudnabacteria bacterium]|nr:PrgI family protein [Candidatus Doudnabacteria bacterium]